MNTAKIVVRKLLLAALAFSAPAWAQSPADPDWINISRMRADQLILSILSVRTDLRQYPMEDLSTTSAQYELMYDETMGPCRRRKDPSQPHQFCAGASVLVNFVGYLKSNQRICPEPETGSCWKPALSDEQMREELFELVRQKRGRQTRLDNNATAVAHQEER